MAEAEPTGREALAGALGAGPTPGPPFATVCIVSAHRRDLLSRCLDSLRDQVAPPAFELLVGADEDPSVEQIVHPRFPAAEVIHLSHPNPAGLRNSLLRHARGEWLLFLDDDVELEPDFLRTMHELAVADPELAVLGGPNIAPRHSSPFQVVQDAVLSSILGSGPVRRRYGRHSAREANEREFTLCTLAVRRDAMADFDEDLVCAEENELLERLRETGWRMSYQPRLLSYHERRPTWRSFAAQMHRYGHGRGQLAVRRPSSLRLAHLVPAGLLLYCAVVLPAAFVFGPAVFAPLMLYLAAVTASAIDVGWTLRRIGAVPSAIAITFVIHLWYGSGVLRGLAAGTARGLGGLLAVPVRHRTLLITLIGRQLKLRTKRSNFGLVWPLVAPFFLFALYLFVFQGIFEVPVDRYPEYLIIGLLPWAFLVQTLSTSINSLSFEPELIRRTRFPYELLPIATGLTMSLYFLASLAGLVAYLGVVGHLSFSLLPLLVVPVASLYLFIGALALILALIDVYNRDLRQVLANLLTVWFFLVPIVYRQRELGSQLNFLQSVDPANLIVGQFRAILYYGLIQNPGHLAAVLAICLGIWLLALAIFRRFAPRLPKEV